MSIGVCGGQIAVGSFVIQAYCTLTELLPKMFLLMSVPMILNSCFSVSAIPSLF